MDAFSFDPSFRTLCEANHCGHYNRNWTCPPHVGDTDTLVREARRFGRAIVYQGVSEIRHPMDWPGTLKAGDDFHRLTMAIMDGLVPKLGKALLLGCGPCRNCDPCAIRSQEPCRHPGKAIRSLEANCVDVGALAARCGMKYVNGPGTVTFFGSLLYGPADDGEG
jgi:predicted metal-binding protein